MVKSTKSLLIATNPITSCPNVAMKILEYYDSLWIQMTRLAGVCQTFRKAAVAVTQKSAMKRRFLPVSTRSDLLAEFEYQEGNEALMRYSILFQLSMEGNGGEHIETFTTIDQMVCQLQKLREQMQHHGCSQAEVKMLLEIAIPWILSRDCSVICKKIEVEDQTSKSFSFFLAFTRDPPNPGEVLFFGLTKPGDVQGSTGLSLNDGSFIFDERALSAHSEVPVVNSHNPFGEFKFPPNAKTPR